MFLPGQQLVSWSKTGLIAYGDSKSPDGNFCLTFLETVNGTNWRFHPPKRYIIHPQLHEVPAKTGGNAASQAGNNLNGSGSTPNFTSGTNEKNAHQFFYNISSVHWNNWFSLPGDMLAVCDEIGNMTMLISGQSPEGPSTIDKLTMLFQDNVYKIYNHVMPLNTVSDTSLKGKLERKRTKKDYHTTILDFHWLSSSKPVILSQFCAFDSSANVYRNKAQQIPPFSVFHPPFMKYACVAVRKNGQIDFWYQFSNSKDHKKITSQLMTFQDERIKELDWLQFAKITPLNDDQSMLISTYSKLSRRLTFFKLHMSWNVNTANPTLLNDPSLKLSHVFDTTIDTVDEEGHVLELTHLHVLSKSPLEKNPSPEVLLVFDVSGSNQSLVRRFRLARMILNNSFISILKTNANTDAKQPIVSKRYNLHYVDKILLDKKIVSVTSEMLDGFVTFYGEDGSVASYNPSDWKLESERLQNQNSEGKFRDIITSTLSAGFTYAKVPPACALEWMQVSPALSGVIFKLEKRDTPNFYPISGALVKDLSKDPVHAAAFAFGFVASIHRQLSSEDLTIACKLHVMRIAEIDVKRAKEFVTTLMSCVYSFFNVSPDAKKEIMDKMISSRPIQKTMLLQLELGSCFTQSNIYEMARVVMSLRNVLFAFSGVARNLHFAIEQLSNSAIQHPSGTSFQTSFSKQDLVHSLIPISKWFVKFVTFLIQEVIMLINNPQGQTNTLVLGVFGARMPRTLILSILNEIKKVTQLVTKFPETTYPVLNESSNFLKMVLGESPVNFEKFETFLVDVNNKFTAFNEQQPSNSREPSLLVKAEIPPNVSKIGDFLLAYSNNAVISHVKANSVYFADTSGLRISNDEFFDSRIFKLLQPLAQGLVIDNEVLPEDCRSSKSFCRVDYDAISYDNLSPEELQDGKLKRCCRCGCVTRAGYVILNNKTIVPTSIQTKRWPTIYARICICSGFLYELEA